MKKKNIKHLFYFIIILLFLIQNSIYSSPNKKGGKNPWEYVGTDEGITVYKREYPNNKFLAIWSHMLLKQKMIKAFYVLQDINNFKKWMPRVYESYYLEKNRKDGKKVSYTVVKGIWPVKDRENIGLSHYRIDKAKKKIYVHFQSLNIYPKMAKRSDRVRIPWSRGLWVLSRNKKGQLKVTLETTGSPGGSIPTWLANWVSEKIPVNVFSNFRNRMKKIKVSPEFIKQHKEILDW